MTSAFSNLGLGIVCVAVLVYPLMVVNFQGWTDPFIIITALGGALIGIVWNRRRSGKILADARQCRLPRWRWPEASPCCCCRASFAINCELLLFSTRTLQRSTQK